MTTRSIPLLAILAGLGLAGCTDPTTDDPGVPPGDSAFRMVATCALTDCDVAEATCLVETDPKEVCGGGACPGCAGGGGGDEQCEACRALCLADHCAALCDAPDSSPCVEHAFAMELPEPRSEVLNACVDYVTALSLADPEAESAALLACDRRARVEVESMEDVYRCLAETPGADLASPGPCPLPVADPEVASSICDRDEAECGSCDPERAQRIAASDGRFETKFQVWLLYCYSDAFDCADRDRCLEAWLSVTE